MTEGKIKQLADEHAEKLIKHKMATHDIFVKEKAKEEIVSVYIAGVEEATKKLQEENEGLRADVQNRLNVEVENVELKKQIEKMKSCSTCENCNEFGKCFNSLKVCRECVEYSNWQLKE